MAIVEYVAGNTIKLTATFSDFDGNTPPSEEPSNIVLKIYDANMKQYGVSITVDGDDLVSSGVYEVYYQVPEDYTRLGLESIMYYKFSGLLQGYIVSSGGKFKRVFIKN